MERGILSEAFRSRRARAAVMMHANGVIALGPPSAVTLIEVDFLLTSRRVRLP